jgi:15-cis-phytoene synthase
MSTHSFDQTLIDSSLKHCKNVTYKYAKTFYFASYFLLKEKRDACYAVYAFCRYVDDLVDSFEQNDENQSFNAASTHLLQEWQKELELVYSGTPSTNPIMIGWMWVLERYHISLNLPKELIEGVLMDTYVTTFDTFEELYTYCYKVASVVGLMTSEIFRYSDKVALNHAIDLGIAMQLTNILRDIGEDLDRGRIYIPQQELELFGVTPEELQNKLVSEKFKQLMKFQIERARKYYESANKGISFLEKDSRTTVRLMSVNYSRILDRIEKNNYDVFSKRASLNFVEKALAIPRALLAS